MTFPAYPEYKDSGVEWLGEVPAHWEVKPLKRAIAAVESGTSVNAADVPAAQGELGVLKTSCVYKGWFDWRENKTVNQEDVGRVSCPLRTNTLIISRMNTPELVGAAGLVVEAPTGMFLPDRLWQVSLEVRSSPKYYYYFTRSPAYRDQVKIACAGTSSSMQNLGQDEFGAIWHPVPPLHDQQVIAAFLDHETARIDALVEKQQRLIELLKEKRQAVISHAVTKGLDPDVPMKDSGVEWLGEVPAHWSVVPLSLAMEYQEGPGIMAADFHDEGVPLLRISGVHGRWATLEGCNYLDPEKVKKRWRHFQLSKGDLVISASASMGTVSEVGKQVAGAVPYTGLIKLRPELGITKKDFIRAFLASDQFSVQIDLLKAGSTIQHFGPTHLSQMKVVLPPIGEQEEIAYYVDTVIERYDRLTDTALDGISLLQERRSALISAAITGKIDVRGWQPPAESSALEATQTEAV